MDQHSILLFIVGVIALAIGFLIAKLLERNNASQVVKNAKKNAKQIYSGVFNALLNLGQKWEIFFCILCKKGIAVLQWRSS